MIKLLINNPQGIQELIEINETGSYYDLSLVLWDERVDGKFPPGFIGKVGGLSRNGQSLQYSPSDYAAQQAILNQQAAQNSAAIAAVNAARSAIAAADITVSLTTDQVQALVKHLVTLTRGQ